MPHQFVGNSSIRDDPEGSRGVFKDGQVPLPLEHPDKLNMRAGSDGIFGAPAGSACLFDKSFWFMCIANQDYAWMDDLHLGTSCLQDSPHEESRKGP